MCNAAAAAAAAAAVAFATILEFLIRFDDIADLWATLVDGGSGNFMLRSCYMRRLFLGRTRPARKPSHVKWNIEGSLEST